MQSLEMAEPGFEPRCDQSQSPCLFLKEAVLFWCELSCPLPCYQLAIQCHLCSHALEGTLDPVVGCLSPICSGWGLWPWTMGDLVFYHLFWEWGPVWPPSPVFCPILKPQAMDLFPTISKLTMLRLLSFLLFVALGKTPACAALGQEPLESTNPPWVSQTQYLVP